jgi:endonuclease-3
MSPKRPKAKKKTAKAPKKAKSKPRATKKSGSRGATKPKSKSKPKSSPIKVTPALRKRAVEIVRGLQEEYPDAHCELDFDNALELLVATILAAQCTDKRVNEVTKTLFKKYRSAQDYVDADVDEFKEEIRSTGFFNNKTRSIMKAAQSIVDQFDGEIPDTMDDLLQLAGVGRKSANVLLVNVYKKPGIVVDTHMLRITRRMGLTTHTDAKKVEFDIREILPEEEWASFSILIPWHGRRTCTARKPACDRCAVAHVCPQLI